MSQPARRVPPGKALTWDEQQQEALAAVSPADIAEAEAWVKRHAPKEAQGLWEAAE